MWGESLRTVDRFACYMGGETLLDYVAAIEALIQ